MAFFCLNLKLENVDENRSPILPIQVPSEDPSYDEVFAIINNVIKYVSIKIVGKRMNDDGKYEITNLSLRINPIEVWTVHPDSNIILAEFTTTYNFNGLAIIKQVT